MFLKEKILHYTLISIFLLTTILCHSQKDYKKKKLSKSELSLLYGYYNQDGDNSAVEGGKGTEELNNHASSIQISLHWDSSKTLDYDVGVDVYSSASTDSVDGSTISSASSEDVRGHANINYQKQINKKTSYSIYASFSQETDYQSKGFGLSLSKYSTNQNRIFSIGTKVYLDQIDRWNGGKRWGLIYPVELRDTTWLNIKRRNTFSINISLQQIINKRMNIAINTEPTVQEGLLSTPFHRVFFQELSSNNFDAKVEQLPNNRFKFPVSLKANYFAWDFLITKWMYRFYSDDFGIRSHTAEIETPIKLIPFITFYPSYRVYKQSGSQYFNSFKEHSIDQRYYTSDFDLSTFTSHQYGLGFKVSPFNGLIRSKSGKKSLQSFSFEYIRYERSTGLKANNFSFSIDFINEQ